MQLFELVSPRLFRPLAGPNRAFYAELLLLLWEECRHTADYSISRAEAVSRAEDYFAALAKPLALDADDAGDEAEQPTRDPHLLALGFLLRLRRTGWLEEQPGSYESEPTLAFVPEVAPLLDALEERLIDAASALSGSGPAFMYMFVEALADGAVACGLPRAKAVEYAAMTMAGSAEMLLATRQHPGALKDAVCSPGGSTIVGVQTLENHGFRGAAMDCVIDTYKKNKELGK